MQFRRELFTFAGVNKMVTSTYFLLLVSERVGVELSVRNTLLNGIVFVVTQTTPFRNLLYEQLYYAIKTLIYAAYYAKNGGGI